MIPLSVADRHCSGRSSPPTGGDASSAGTLSDTLLLTPILIIEDEAMIAWMLESLFEDMGFSAITLVGSGEDALAAVAMQSPGLVISDINLGSGLDGVAVAAAIRASCPAPILFVTGYASSDARERIARDVPGARVLRKPIQPDELRQVVVAALRPNTKH